MDATLLWPPYLWMRWRHMEPYNPTHPKSKARLSNIPIRGFLLGLGWVVGLSLSTCRAPGAADLLAEPLRKVEVEGQEMVHWI